MEIQMSNMSSYCQIKYFYRYKIHMKLIVSFQSKIKIEMKLSIYQARYLGSAGEAPRRRGFHTQPSYKTAIVWANLCL